MTPIAVIPARYGSTRLPGKALADLHGTPMIVRVLKQVQQSTRLSTVLVATDDVRIKAAVEAAGGTAVMTSPAHTSGTDRVMEAVGGHPAEVIVNIQGDEPLIDPATIDALIGAMEDERIEVATAAAPLDGDPADPATVKVVTDAGGRALYFSRAPIPHGGPYRHHIGIYAYRRAALARFVGCPPSALERTERLEQLRFLELGCAIAVVGVDAASPSVDTPADLEAVRHILKP